MDMKLALLVADWKEHYKSSSSELNPKAVMSPTSMSLI